MSQQPRRRGARRGPERRGSVGEPRQPGAGKRDPERSTPNPPNDWRAYRPAIWMAMLGIAVLLLINPPWIAAAPLGAAIGIGVRIRQRRHRLAPSSDPRRRR